MEWLASRGCIWRPPTPRGRGNDGDTAPSDLAIVAIVAMPAVKPERFFRQHDLSYQVSLVSGELDTGHVELSRPKISRKQLNIFSVVKSEHKL